MIENCQPVSARGQSIWKSGLGLESTEVAFIARILLIDQRRYLRPKPSRPVRSPSDGGMPIVCSASGVLAVSAPLASVLPGGPMSRRAATSKLSSGQIADPALSVQGSPRAEIIDHEHGSRSSVAFFFNSVGARSLLADRAALIFLSGSQSDELKAPCGIAARRFVHVRHPSLPGGKEARAFSAP